MRELIRREEWIEISSFIEIRNVFVGDIISYEFRCMNRNERKKERKNVSEEFYEFYEFSVFISFFFFLFH